MWESHGFEKRVDALEKDYGRLCQNDSVMRTEHSVAFKRLDKQDEEIKELKMLITNLHKECQRLYNIGFSNGIETAYTEISDNIKRLEDKGLISYHGFLMEGKTKPNNELDKLSESIYNQLGISANKLKPESATKIADEAWRKFAEVNKPLKTCYTKLCTGCKDLHSDGYDLINRGYRLYTCKKKGVSVLSNIMPKPENFVAAFKKEEK